MKFLWDFAKGFAFGLLAGGAGTLLGIGVYLALSELFR